eukprot:gene12177-13314_t
MIPLKAVSLSSSLVFGVRIYFNFFIISFVLLPVVKSINCLYPGGQITPGQCLVSNSGAYKFCQKSDGSVCVTNSGGSNTWCAASATANAQNVLLQGDGNIVAYTTTTYYWASWTNGKAIAYFIIQDDGQVVAYDASGTSWYTCNTASPSCPKTTCTNCKVCNNAPTAIPTAAPSANPTTSPTTAPTRSPTAQPTYTPTYVPTPTPTVVPSTVPSFIPSQTPTVTPTYTPSYTPSATPTGSPTAIPSFGPTTQPTSAPTITPTECPTLVPSFFPSAVPSAVPSALPSCAPSIIPTTTPSFTPSVAPTFVPSVLPTYNPSTTPSCNPSSIPTNLPSYQPNGIPTSTPSGLPSARPTSQPSVIPSHQPTSDPSSVPSSIPSIRPTSLPTQQPTDAVNLKISPSIANFKQILFLFGQQREFEPPLQDIIPKRGDLKNNYLFFGNDQIPSSVSINETEVILLDTGLKYDTSFRSIAYEGDYNDDNRSDLVIGDPLNSRAYVLFGQTNQVFQLNKGLIIHGDFNGDGVNDIAVGSIPISGSSISDQVAFIVYG